MKHYVNAKKISKSRDARQNFLNFYDELPNAEFFDEVDKNCFKERSNHVKIADKAVEKAKKQKINLF